MHVKELYVRINNSNKKPLFEDLNLWIPKNTITLLCGNSNVGKTTLLKILTLVQKRSLLVTHHCEIDCYCKYEKTDVVYLDSDFKVLENYNGFKLIEALKFVGTNTQKTQSLLNNQIQILLRIFDLDELIIIKNTDISEKNIFVLKLIKIAILLVSRVKYFFCDDLLYSLSAPNQKKLLKYLNRAVYEFKVTFVISHTQPNNLILSFVHRVCILRNKTCILNAFIKEKFDETENLNLSCNVLDTFELAANSFLETKGCSQIFSNQIPTHIDETNSISSYNQPSTNSSISQQSLKCIYYECVRNIRQIKIKQKNIALICFIMIVEGLIFGTLFIDTLQINYEAFVLNKSPISNEDLYLINAENRHLSAFNSTHIEPFNQTSITKTSNPQNSKNLFNFNTKENETNKIFNYTANTIVKNDPLAYLSRLIETGVNKQTHTNLILDFFNNAEQLSKYAIDSILCLREALPITGFEIERWEFKEKTDLDVLERFIEGLTALIQIIDVLLATDFHLPSIEQFRNDVGTMFLPVTQKLTPYLSAIMCCSGFSTTFNLFNVKVKKSCSSAFPKAKLPEIPELIFFNINLLIPRELQFTHHEGYVETLEAPVKSNIVAQVLNDVIDKDGSIKRENLSTLISASGNMLANLFAETNPLKEIIVARTNQLSRNIRRPSRARRLEDQIFIETAESEISDRNSKLLDKSTELKDMFAESVTHNFRELNTIKNTIQELYQTLQMCKTKQCVNIQSFVKSSSTELAQILMQFYFFFKAESCLVFGLCLISINSILALNQNYKLNIKDLRKFSKQQFLARIAVSQLFGLLFNGLLSTLFSIVVLINSKASNKEFIINYLLSNILLGFVTHALAFAIATFSKSHNYAQATLILFLSTMLIGEVISLLPYYSQVKNISKLSVFYYASQISFSKLIEQISYNKLLYSNFSVFFNSSDRLVHNTLVLLLATSFIFGISCLQLSKRSCNLKLAK